ncbi:LETM1-domain-containing protein [Rhizoclosmatium globosum]|uniref:Mitochondrial proton/calcium exchanger protein n=1 Tax=Rhizoclosmatium globosum TaxID=329046 RepID=A0A1Y2C6R9_9FUNG|nr:LETM1-domain-containing protein [Rhizoclosmatium globosum]|eukprot:ORY42730.1 LETM1-domain-containing protein [Rhizoclosmatium globosum]
MYRAVTGPSRSLTARTRTQPMFSGASVGSSGVRTSTTGARGIVSVPVSVTPQKGLRGSSLSTPPQSLTLTRLAAQSYPSSMIAASSVFTRSFASGPGSTVSTKDTGATAPIEDKKPPKPETSIDKVIKEIKAEQLEEKAELEQAASAAATTTTASASTASTASTASASSTTASATTTTTTTTTTSAANPANAVAAPAEPKKSLIQRIKDEAHHLWVGMQLLGAETRISARLLKKLMEGKSLSRREDLQLKRTVADLLRFVPMIIILIIPFLELALPLLLYIFPNMLPSTFESKFQAEEKKKKLLKVRLEMAKFLQDTVAEVAITGTSRAAKAKEFSDFFQKYRNSGLLAPTDEILKISKKFQDDLTLNSLSRPQLVSMARYMSLNAFGTDTYLRNQINDQLVSLKLDDAAIAKEGVDALTIPELQAACQNRGIKTIGASPARLKSELTQWLDLHLTHGVPGSLLILSRAFTISERIPLSTEEALKESAGALQATLSSLPQQVVNEAQLQVAQVAGTATSNQKLNVLKEQEELIEDELEQDENEKAKGTAAVAAAAAAAAPAAAATAAAAATPAAAATAASTAAKTASTGAADIHEEVDIPKEELKKVGEAIKVMVSNSALDDVKAKLVDLKVEQKEIAEDIEELKQVTNKESKAAAAVTSRVEKMISKIEAEITKIDSEIGSKMNVIQPNAEGQLSVEEIHNALSMVKDNPGAERIQKIIKRLDSDGDGVVSIPEVMAFVNETEKGAAAKTDGAAAAAATTATTATNVSSSSSSTTPKQ